MPKRKSCSNILKRIVCCLEKKLYPHVLYWHDRVQMKFVVVFVHKNNPGWNESYLALFEDLDRLSNKNYFQRSDHITACKVRCKSNLNKLCVEGVLVNCGKKRFTCEKSKKITYEKSKFSVCYQIKDPTGIYRQLMTNQIDMGNADYHVENYKQEVELTSEEPQKAEKLVDIDFSQTSHYPCLSDQSLTHNEDLSNGSVMDYNTVMEIPLAKAGEQSSYGLKEILPHNKVSQISTEQGAVKCNENYNLHDEPSLFFDKTIFTNGINANVENKFPLNEQNTFEISRLGIYDKSSTHNEDLSNGSVMDYNTVMYPDENLSSIDRSVECSLYPSDPNFGGMRKVNCSDLNSVKETSEVSEELGIENTSYHYFCVENGVNYYQTGDSVMNIVDVGGIGNENGVNNYQFEDSFVNISYVGGIGDLDEPSIFCWENSDDPFMCCGSATACSCAENGNFALDK